MNDSKPNNIICESVDYQDVAQMRDLVHLLNEYSIDPMGNGKPLSGDILDKLLVKLPNVPGAFSFIAYDNGGGDKIPVGLINCFPGFSTFVAEPLINIHDIVVLKSKRGLGIGKLLIRTVEQKARELNCCKITLEVRTDNPAEKLYRYLGFTDGNQQMVFLSKPLK